MADKKKQKSKMRRDEDVETPTKEECSVGKHLRFGLPQKEAKLVGMTVKYFIASEAVDNLMATKWATQKSKQDNLFNNRNSCINYMDRLLNKGMFHRALKAEKKKRDERGARKKDVEEPAPVDDGDDKKLRRRKKDKDKDKTAEKKQEKEDRSEKEDTEKEDKKDDKKDEKKKKEKKMKLRMHDDQVFVDGEEVYVWIYDPVNVKTFVIGLLMVLGTIGLCMFPLWPPIVRQGVYYLSLAGAVFVGFILFLAVLRFILFCCVWVCSAGKHHFWLLPNLTEDVGFMDSFKPLYTHSYKGNTPTDGDDKTTTDKPKQGKTKKDSSDTKTKEKGSDKEGSESSDAGYEMVDKSEVTESEH